MKRFEVEMLLLDISNFVGNVKAMHSALESKDPHYLETASLYSEFAASAYHRILRSLEREI